MIISGTTLQGVTNTPYYEPPPAPLVLGQAYGGGYFAGQISTTGNGVATHNLVVAPRATGSYNVYPGHSGLQWSPYDTTNNGASSYIDGPSNNAFLVTKNSPAAIFCRNLTIGGYGDWYLPSLYELEILYYNFKPQQHYNATSYGSNPYSVPTRVSNYSSTPTQTSVSAFQFGGSESLIFPESSIAEYWSSTFWGNDGYDYAWVIDFSGQYVVGTGYQFRKYFASSGQSIRAIRRVPV